jgi:hypothetical protein
VRPERELFSRKETGGGATMTDREKLEREIYEFTEMIRADMDALRLPSISEVNKAYLQRAIAIRSAELSRLKERLAAFPN